MKQAISSPRGSMPWVSILSKDGVDGCVTWHSHAMGTILTMARLTLRRQPTSVISDSP